MIAATSPYYGQVGRVCRVFWRGDAPWILLRSSDGRVLTLPWSVTDLPVPMTTHAEPPSPQDAVLLSPTALLALVRFLRRRAAENVSAELSPRRRR
ncbi:MAG: hypothetical protein M3380_12080 [Chloroflexota bacterium]|nr:hypothetical protein [Chloroflexota bacterium]